MYTILRVKNIKADVDKIWQHINKYIHFIYLITCDAKLHIRITYNVYFPKKNPFRKYFLFIFYTQYNLKGVSYFF